MHRDELIALMQSAECLRECRVVRSLQHVLSEKPSAETLLQPSEPEDAAKLQVAERQQQVRFVACIDPQMPWIKVHPSESASFVCTTSVETISGEDAGSDKATLLAASERQPAVEQMRREIDELRQVVGQLLLGQQQHKPASRPVCK